MNLVVTHSPHLRTKDSTQRIMKDVLIALIPVSISGILTFGLDALVLMLGCMVSAMLTEALLKNGFKGLTGKKIFGDGSAAITGLILAQVITPLLPLWMAMLGSALAIFIGKHVFGGIGQNPFNPALVGRAILFTAFPVYMSKWQLVDTVSTATPLVAGSSDYLRLFIGNYGGCLGETSVLAILLGALFLLYRGHISWHIPVAYLATTAALSVAFGVDPIFAVMAGGVAYGAVFMATDMVTSPITKTGQLVFGVGCGLITVIIREMGALPEGVMFSILIMNALTPLIDKVVKPHLFGGVKNA